MSNFLATANNTELSIIEMEHEALPMVSMKVSDVAGEMSYLANRTTRHLNKYLNGRTLDIDNLDEEISSFIADWVMDDEKFSNWYDEQEDKELVHNTIKDLAYKSQLENLNHAGKIQSKELRLLVSITSDSTSPYRAGQRIMKPIRSRLNELSEELRIFNCQSIDVEDEHKLLIEKINELVDKIPELITEGLEEMANTIDSMVHDYRNT
ncbi:MAG: hypothetical protein KZQ83_13345 [gamma proteobacterium symbiont of Taylorina sp.]|nr:hypothetical protein [gamma proteobacterium symbiont of Taylorina sp.]